VRGTRTYRYRGGRFSRIRNTQTLALHRGPADVDPQPARLTCRGEGEGAAPSNSREPSCPARCR
jgi:hypothetical protein